MKKYKFVSILMIFGLFFNFGCYDSDIEVNNEPANNDNNTISEVKKEQKSYGLNEDVYIKSDDGEYRLRITNISETSDRNPFSDVVANRVIIIDYEYENISDEDDVLISDYNFKVYDSNNDKLETYPVTTKYGGSVGVGRKVTASMAYALNNDSNYIELEYYDNMFYSRSNCIFKINW